MPIPIICGCGKKFQVEENLAGQQVQCQCGNVFVVPEKTNIPWQKYYRSGWRRLKGRLFPQLDLTLLRDELISYWGFLIAKEAEEIGMERFTLIEPVYQEWKQLQVELLGEQNPKKVARLARQTRQYSREIGRYCWGEGYRFQKFSEIWRVENPLVSVDTSMKCQEMAGMLWRRASRALPWYSRFSTLVGTGLMSLIAIALYTAWLTIPEKFFASALFGIALVFCLVPFLLRHRKHRREKKRLTQLWRRNLAQTGEDFISPEIVERWVDSIFEGPFSGWRHTSAEEIAIPEDFSSGFIPDVEFADDNAAEFGVDYDEEVEKWCQDLYNYCRESFTPPRAVNYCFFYSENRPRLDKFLQKLREIMGEVNETQGEEVLWIGRYNCTGPERLGIFFALLDPMLRVEKFSSDRHWQTACQLFDFMKILVNIYNYKEVPSEAADRLISPVFLEIFAGLRNCLYILAQRRPLLLVIDNLDHTDPESLNFICSLTQEKRSHRLCFLVSYNRESVLRMPPLKETIITLQKESCWKTPEKEIEEHTLSQSLIGKAAQWEILESSFSSCVNRSSLQIAGIEGGSGSGKTYLGQQFLNACAKEGNLWTVYHSYSGNLWEDLDNLVPIKKILELCKEDRSGIPPALYERAVVLSDFLKIAPDESGQKGRFPGKKPSAQILAEKLTNFEKSDLSPQEIASLRRNNFHREVSEVLSQLACHRPILFFLDNGDLADLAMLDFLVYMATQPPAAPILIMLSFSSSQKGRTNFENFLQQVEATSCYQQIVLNPPAPEELARYIGEEWKPNLLAESPESPFVQFLMKISSGNVLLITEYLKWLLVTRALYHFGGFWMLKEEVLEQSIDLERLLRQFVNTFPTEDQKLISAILRESSVYGEAVPIAYLGKALAELGWTERDVQAALDRALSKSILFKPSSQQGYFEFIHPQYRLALYHSIPAEQRKEMHQKVLQYLSDTDNQDITFMLYHAEAAKSWEYVLDYSEVLGRHSLSLLELPTASAIFERGIFAAQNLEEIPALANYYLLKARAFPSKRPWPTFESLQTMLTQKQWDRALNLSLSLPDASRSCAIFLKFLENVGTLRREEVTILVRHLLTLLLKVKSEYSRSQLLERFILLVPKSDPLQLRALVERSLTVVDTIYDANTKSDLLLKLQRQLGEMDLDLIRTISGRISPIRCSAEKTLSLNYLASFVPKNQGLAAVLMEEAERIVNRVYRIMAFRVIAHHLLACAPAEAVPLLMRIAEFIMDISLHVRRMEALASFISGQYREIRQEPLDRFLPSLAPNARQQIVESLFKIVQQTIEVPMRIECLKGLAATLCQLTEAQGYKKLIESFVEELKKCKSPLERADGFLAIAAAILEGNINLAQQYSEAGLSEIEAMYSEEAPGGEQNPDEVIEMLHKILSVLQKLPQPIVYPLWDRAIKIAQQLETERQDPLFSAMVVSLFPYDQEKSLELATHIRSIKYRHSTVERLLSLPGKTISAEMVEKVILEYARENYGNVLLQHISERDPGRARRMLRELPESLETQITSTRLCRPSGQRIREILKLLRGADTEIVAEILLSLERLLKHKEYDPQGNAILPETLPDSYPEKISVLMALTYATHEVDPALACECLVRIAPLVEKHMLETEELSPSWKTVLADVEELLKQLQPAFIQTYIERIVPAMEVISDVSIKGALIQNLCEKLKLVAPHIGDDIMQKTAGPRLRFPILQGMANLEFLEPLTSLSMVESVYPTLGQPIRHILTETIASYPDAHQRIDASIEILVASGNWDLAFSDSIFQNILKDLRNLPQRELAPYYRILDVLRRAPFASRNRFLSALIHELTDHTGRIPPASLCGTRHCFWNALFILDALVPFGPSHCHSFVMKLLSIPKVSTDFAQTIECIHEFLFLSRGLAPEKEAEWIAEAIGYLDTATQETENPALQEDYYLLRALQTVQFSKWLVIIEPAKALQAAQRALQLTEYSVRRPRLHRYILLQISSLMDVVQAEIREKAPHLFRPIELMRFQWAYYHMQALKGGSPEERKQALQEEKNIAKENLHYLLNYLAGNAGTLDMSEIEEAWTIAYQQFESEIEECFEKLAGAKEGAGLTQAFFILTQALCIMEEQTLSSWRRVPWFQRLVRIAARVNPEEFSQAGDDHLQADEREEFALVVRRVSLVYPKSVLFLIKSLFSSEKVWEISANLEDEAVSEELLRSMIEPLKNASLSQYRDRLLTELAMEWAEYNWVDGFLLVTMIGDFELEAETIRRLVRKTCDFYPQDILNISNRAYAILQKVKSCQAKNAAMEEVALRLVEKNALQALQIISAIETPERQRELLKKIIARIGLDQAFLFAAQVVDAEMRAACLIDILCILPEDAARRLHYLPRLWEMARQIEEDSLRFSLLKEIVRTGLNEKVIAEQPQEVANILLEIWENASRTDIELAFRVFSATLPAFIKMLDDKAAVRDLFQVLYQPEYLPPSLLRSDSQ